MKIQPNELGVKRVLENFFNFSSAEAEEFIVNATGELRQNYVKMYEKDGSEYLKKFLANQLHWNYDNMLWTYKVYITLLQLDENTFYGKILDIGSAWGDFLYMAKRKNAFQNSELVGIDINKNFIKKWCDAGLDIRYMDARELDFPDESFDLVISHGAMPQLLYSGDDERFWTDVNNFLKNISKILKPNGELRIYASNARYKKPIGTLIENIFDDCKYFSKLEKRIILVDEKEEEQQQGHDDFYCYIFKK